MNNNERTLAELQENLKKGNVLSYNNILALTDAFGYGTATPMIALIKTLRMMKTQIAEGRNISYMDKDDVVKTINLNNFDEFILDMFDEFVLKEIKK